MSMYVSLHVHMYTFTITQTHKHTPTHIHTCMICITLYKRVVNGNDAMICYYCIVIGLLQQQQQYIKSSLDSAAIACRITLSHLLTTFHY